MVTSDSVHDNTPKVAQNDHADAGILTEASMVQGSNSDNTDGDTLRIFGKSWSALVIDAK